MRFLLDTNAVIALLGGHPDFHGRLRQHNSQDFAIPAIVVHELCYGAFRSQRTAENLARVDSLQFSVLEFDREDARQVGRVRAALAAAGTPIGPYDVLIAGQALARDLTLITHNTREFHRVQDLCVEDWI